MKIDVVDGNVVIVIPATKAARAAATASKSGKMKLLATSNGFTSVSTPDGTVRVSINAGF